MTTKKLILAVTLATMVFASLAARADEVEERDLKTKIVSLHEGGRAGRLAERMIGRSDVNLYQGRTTTVATVEGDGITYMPEARSLNKLQSFSKKTLTYLVQSGKCDFHDSACIAFEDKTDNAYRLSTRRNDDGSVDVLVANMENFSSVPLKDMIRTMDKKLKPKSVIFTRANSSY